GGGLTENLPRVMPEGTRAIIDSTRWQRPPVFDWLQEKGNVAEDEMYRTFNCGIGMVLCVGETDVERSLALLAEQGESASVIGRIETGEGEQVVIG
ncbi:MAG TPA: phosphoribosylformylglycinamidine cyclo-ligase, partial [Thiotrichales bacterium]|nr:phosphoribosylformylglycinamidine cyclo-ligase [Thiotrichales bacterium]